MIYRVCMLACMMGFSLVGPAQVIELVEKMPVTENGFQYGFIVNNEQVKEAGGEEYSRYELSFFITNQSGCNKMFAERSGVFSQATRSALAGFQCLNANGKRFTSKSANINARDFYITVKKMVDKKEVLETVKAGYIFRNGETLKTNVIVLVPKGERPVIQCTPNTLPELQ